MEAKGYVSEITSKRSAILPGLSLKLVACYLLFCQFVSHPVVFNLMTSKYYRSFTSERKKPWTSLKRWGYLFLNVWTVLDMFFFPLFFALFSVVHFVNKKLRKTTG